MASPLSLVTAIALAAIGFGLAYFGYEIAQKLLGIAGAIGGFAAGIGLATVVAPTVTGSSVSPVVMLVVALFGAVLGRVFVPALSPLAFGLVGFVVTVLAVLAFLSQGRILDVILNAIPTNLATANPELILQRIASAPLFSDPNFDQALLLAVVAGVIGGIIALKLYDEFVTVATTVIGASMLGLAIPILIDTFQGGAPTVGAGEFSFLWFGVTLVTGIAFEFARNRDKMDLA
ncbi:hypothetical protein [Salinibaculum salinum]|uniref:hypothetical protein n=1 Tax=Salinibaculum salinum TaxID=3131996 RepID=UPI0030ED213A